MLLIEKDSWFAVQVTPRHEKRVDTILQQQNYGHFLPMRRTRRKWSDRVKVIEQPLFPGYVFVRTQSCSVGKIHRIPGFIRVVSFGGRPCSVPDIQIEALQRIIDSKRDIFPIQYLAVGQKVQIVTGPLSGLIGIISHYKNCGRLVVSVDLIMRSIVVEIDGEEVVPLSSAPPDRLCLAMTA
jgi:transcription termination/antitermination protein NusG